MNDQSTMYRDMLSAIEHVLATSEYAAASPGDGAEMIALAVCAALAERRGIYVPYPATILARKNRTARNNRILSLAKGGASPSRIASHVRLSPRQVRRILHQHTETIDRTSESFARQFPPNPT